MAPQRLSTLTRVSAVFFVVATVMACAPQSVGPEADSGPQVTFSRPGVLKAYQAFYVEPVEAYTNDSGRLVPASSREIQNLAESFRQKIIRALGPRHTLFNQPAREVAILKVSISDVWSNRALLNLRPGWLVPNALEGGASMQAEVIDTVTNERVALITDSRRGARQGYLSGLTKWGGTEAAFDEWGLLLRHSIRKGGG